MASIWNDIKLEWEGEEIIVKPDLEFINRLEQKQGASISLLLGRMTNGDVPMGIACHMIGTTLREGGVNIKDEEIFAKYLELGSKVGVMLGTIAAGCLPMPKDKKAEEGK